MLQIQNLTKIYKGPKGEVRALQNISFRVEAGEFSAVQGPSGCGKTTLLLAAGGLLKPDSGEIRIHGENPYGLSANERARFRATTIGFVFQQFHLVPYLNVMENVLAATLAMPQGDGRERAKELVARFGLSDRLDHVPASLSTGEKQRVALARALLNRPKLLLADEPTGNLDRENARIVLEHMTAFAKSGGAVLLVTHDANAAQYAQRGIFLEKGKMAERRA